MTAAFRFSIVLCTRNRAHLLESALDSLIALDYSPDAFELVLVDNGSTDGTAQTVARFERQARFPVRYVYEGRAGLSIARNRGIREARGVHLFFTDDDQLVDKAVLKEYDRVLERHGGRVFQGAIELSFTSARPRWLHGSLTALLGETAQAPEGSVAATLFGGNVLAHRDVFREFAGFHEALGKGAAGYSEDSELAQRLTAAGETIRYAPTARVYHLIGPERTTVGFFRKTSFEKGRAHGRLERPEPSRRAAFKRAARYIREHAAQAIKFALRGDTQASIDAQTRAAFELGKVVAWANPARRMQ